MIIPTTAGCVYFLPQVPDRPRVAITMVKVCSCSPLGVLSFDTDALKDMGLIGEDGLSTVSMVVTGPMISVSLYSSGNFQNDIQYTVGQSLQLVLANIPRLLPKGKGKLVADGPSTWDKQTYSLVLNSWSRCQAPSAECPGASLTGPGTSGGTAQIAWASDDAKPATSHSSNSKSNSVTDDKVSHTWLMTSAPQSAPTPGPTNPSPLPTFEPTYTPTAGPTLPTFAPTPEPTHEPTLEPSPVPTRPTPTAYPTFAPTYGEDVVICTNPLMKGALPLDLTIEPGCAAFLMRY